MGSPGSFILPICLGAILVAILSRFLDGKSSTGSLCRMLCGLFLAFLVLKPLVRFRYEDLELFTESFSLTADAAAAEGATLANDTTREIIKQKMEAYILDKAGLYDCHLQVEIVMGEGDVPLPEYVVVCGAASPYAKAQLQRAISDDLGIPKEYQKWIGQVP